MVVFQYVFLGRVGICVFANRLGIISQVLVSVKIKKEVPL